MQDQIQERIEQMFKQKRQDITWLNSKNCAVQIVSCQLPKGFRNRNAIAKEVRLWADWFYEQSPIRKIVKKPKQPAKKISKKDLQKLLKSARRKVKNVKR